MTGISYKTWKMANVALYIGAIRHYEARHDANDEFAWEWAARHCREHIRALRELTGRADIAVTDWATKRGLEQFLEKKAPL